MLVAGRERELVRDGVRNRDEMRKALVAQRDLDEAIRKKEGDETMPVERAMLERDGVVTVRTAVLRASARGMRICADLMPW